MSCLRVCNFCRFETETITHRGGDEFCDMSSAAEPAQMQSGSANPTGKHEGAAKFAVKAWWLDGPSLSQARHQEIFDVPPKKKGTSSAWLEFEQNL